VIVASRSMMKQSKLPAATVTGSGGWT
jgi:hypothetical protein